jgi:hypothetical protein
MPIRLPLLLVLLFFATLLMAAGAHGATFPALPTLQPLAEEEEPFETETEEEDVEEEAEEEAGEAEGDEAGAAPAQPRRHGESGRPHRRKKACRKRAGRKRHCKRGRRDGGFNSRARGGATGQAGRRTPTSE